MNRLDDHYEVLGIAASASVDAVEKAVERLAEQADVLAYTSPRRSNELWTRIRQIRQDLLTDPERRAAYDDALLHARTGTFAPIVTPERAPPGGAEASSAGRARRVSVIGVLASGLVAAAIVLANMGDSTHPPRTISRPVAMVLSVAGRRHDGWYQSDQPIRLGWSSVPHARRYQLTIMTKKTGHSLPFRTITTTDTSYRVTLPGQQRYLWRVRPDIGGHWGRASRWEVVMVARPSIGTPSPESPPDRSTIVATQVRFCWTSVPGAAGYRLRIRGVGGRTLQDTCAWMSVRSGTYRWTVAARVAGVHTYTGRFTARQYFTVVAQVASRIVPIHHLSKRNVSHHRTARVKSRNRRRSASAVKSRRATPRAAVAAGSVVVAAAIFPRSAVFYRAGRAVRSAGLVRPVSSVIHSSVVRRVAAVRAPSRVATVVRAVVARVPIVAHPVAPRVKPTAIHQPARPLPGVPASGPPGGLTAVHSQRPLPPPSPPQNIPQPPISAPMPTSAAGAAVPLPAQPVYGASRPVSSSPSVSSSAGAGPSSNQIGIDAAAHSAPISQPQVSSQVAPPSVALPVRAPTTAGPQPAEMPPSGDTTGQQADTGHRDHPEHPQHPVHPPHGKGH